MITISTMPDDAARQRFGELMWYTEHNIALPDEELEEVETLAERFGIRLVWRHFVLGKELEWKEGRGS